MIKDFRSFHCLPTPTEVTEFRSLHGEAPVFHDPSCCQAWPRTHAWDRVKSCKWIKRSNLDIPEIKASTEITPLNDTSARGFCEHTSYDMNRHAETGFRTMSGVQPSAAIASSNPADLCQRRQAPHAQSLQALVGQVGQATSPLPAGIPRAEL